MYLVDLDGQSARQVLDWNTPDIEWHGYGGDRGLRGIAFDSGTLYVAASNSLLAYTPDFELIGSWQNPYLRYCQDMAVWGRTLYLTSSGYDSILGFDLDSRRFHWAFNLKSAGPRFSGTVFDPQSDDGPLLMQKLRLSSLFCNPQGMYLSGLRTGGMLHFNGERVNMAVQLPAESNNARPFRDGVIFNDNEHDVLRYTGRGEGREDRGMPVPDCDRRSLRHTEAVDDGIARPGFARGLCVLSDRLVVGGSSPSTLCLYDLAANETLGSVSLSRDVRSTPHTIAEWPF